MSFAKSFGGHPQASKRCSGGSFTTRQAETLLAMETMKGGCEGWHLKSDVSRHVFFGSRLTEPDPTHTVYITTCF